MTISDAMTRGVKKAGRIITNPDPRDNRAYRRKVRAYSPLEAAWQNTGTELYKAMQTQQNTLRENS